MIRCPAGTADEAYCTMPLGQVQSSPQLPTVPGMVAGHSQYQRNYPACSFKMARTILLKTVAVGEEEVKFNFPDTEVEEF